MTGKRSAVRIVRDIQDIPRERLIDPPSVCARCNVPVSDFANFDEFVAFMTTLLCKECREKRKE